MAKEPKSERKVKATNLITIIPLKVIVLLDGLAVGPFSTGEAALGWAIEHSKDGIYQLKELIPPGLEI